MNEATLPAVVSFAYDNLAADVADNVRAAAEAIRARFRRTTDDMLEIGRKLLAVRSALPHGDWLPWLESEVGLSERTAQTFIRAAQAFGDEGKSEMISDLPPTAVSRLAAAPPAVRADVVARFAAGERVTVAEIERTIRAVKAPVLAPPTMPPFASDLASALEEYQRERVALLAASIAAFAADVVAVAKRAESTRCTKKWARAAWQTTSDIIDEAQHLTGRRYARLESHFQIGPKRLACPERVDSVLAVVCDIKSCCEGIKFHGYPEPTAAQLADWAARLRAAGL